MSIRKASTRTTVNSGVNAAAAATINQITVAPATATTVAGGGTIGGGGGVTISNVSIMSNAFANATVLSGDTAISTAGGFVRVTGTGFKSNAVVYFNNTAVSNTFVSSTQINATIPSSSASTYNFYIFNNDGSGGILANGLQTSGPPSWTTTSYSSTGLTLGNIQLLATGDAPLTFYIQPGSANPQNLAVNSAGYLSGTVSGEGAYTITVVVDDAQSQSTQADITVTVSVADPYFNLTTLQLAGEGTNNANNQSFIDSSSNNFTITRNGNATQGTFTPFSQTGWSNFFNSANTDHLALPFNSVDVAANNFALEAWVYVFDRAGIYTVFNSQTNASTASGSSYGLNIQATNGFLDSSWYVGGGTYNLQGTTAVPLNQWNHCALVRTGGTMSIYLNGVRQATRSDMSTNTINAGSASLQPYIGRNGTFYPFNGFISDFRIVIGSHPYDATSASLTVPTSRLTAVTNTAVLACNSNRFVDTNTQVAAKTITVAGGTPSVQAFSPFAPTAAYTAATVGGSGYFDGTGDHLTVPNSGTFNFGAPSGNTNDFSVEFWLYQTNTSITSMVGTAYSAGINNYWMFTTNRRGSDGANVAGYLNLYLTDSFFIETTSGFLPNSWNHIVGCRTGTTVSLFLNGTRVATNTTSVNPNSSGVLQVGAEASTLGRNLTGYISNLRIVRGSTQPYSASSSSITLPTAPPTAITNTSFLLNFTNAGITDATAKNIFETVGDAKISTAASKFGSSSMFFDGTGDALVAPYSPLFSFGTGAFTIEGWVNFSTLSGNRLIFDTYTSAALGGGYQVYWRGAGTNIVFYANGGLQAQSSFTTHVTGTWYHIAVTRTAAGLLQIFIDGVSYASVTYTTAIDIATTAKTALGVQAATSTNYFHGYIDDFRVTRGFARYTANFTPPTATYRLQ